MYYFLEEDFKELCFKINELNEKLTEIGQEMGESCRQSSETYHDNFPFEEGRRQQDMISTRISELINIKSRAKIIQPDITSNCVSIGKIVVIKDEGTNEEETYKIGSYMIFKRLHGYVSYNAPLVKLILGAKAGDVREGKIESKNKVLKVLKVI
ncbi:MAG: GreA/GreB family elongation factor [Candidatus Pacebacteria bacterium]|nr:GreA/GreB family elongation factor [Candidatus Paceibacterota bacterium]